MLAMEKSVFRFVKSLSCLCGVVLALGLSPLNFWYLAPVALFGICTLLANHAPETWRSWYFTGLCFGFGYFVAALHWIGFAFLVDAKHYLWMMPFALGGLCLFLACYWGLAFLAAFHARKTVPLILSVPIFLTCAEWLRGHLFTGFPWASPGMIMNGMGGTEQLASLLGLYGLSFCILLWAMLPWHMVQDWRRNRRVSWRSVIVAVSLPAAWLWGEWRLAENPTTFVADVNLRLVQPNISQSDKWRDENKLKIYEQLLALSSETSQTKPSVVVWPESSVPFLLDESSVGLARIGDMLGDGGVLVAGAIRREKTNGVSDRYFTSVLAINNKGAVTGHYDKWRLVPGGEFLPLAWLLEPLGFSKIANLAESFSAGDGPHSLVIGRAGLAAPLICYEAIFPDNVVDATQRPHWLVNVTNDGWFGKSVGPWQHLAQARMRAIEQGLPLVRAANTGVSAVIDPVGRVIVASDIEKTTVIDSKLPQSINATVFARFNALPWALLMLLVMVLLGEKPRKSFER
jgi:apolipoprotein N-acyltransferase